MKKAEAISILATSVRPREPKDRARYDEAVKMAIETLKSSERTAEIAQNVQNGDLIQRKAAIDAVNDLSYPSSLVDVKRILVDLPVVQPGIIRCKGCIYYDPPHVENNGVRYEYTEMPEEAFDVLGTGLVTVEYGINVGGRCCRDYNVGYADDKRIYVPEDNYCGRAERRTDG